MGTDFKYKIFGKEYTPQHISAFILQKIKKDAEAFLGEPVNDAVITVPAYFNDNQRFAVVQCFYCLLFFLVLLCILLGFLFHFFYFLLGKLI